MKEKYYERLKRLSKDPNSSMLFWGYEASAILKEIERLNNIIKIKDEGIKAFTEDLCETTEELERLNNIINEAIEYIDRRDIEWGSEEHNKLLDILKGSDNE